MEQKLVQSPIDRALSLLARPMESTRADSKSSARSFVPDVEAKPKPVADDADERREHPRRDSSSRVMMSFGLMDISDPAWNFRSTPHRGHLLDLSMRGAAFESDLPAAPNTVVVLRLAGGDFDDGRMLRAKIVRCDTMDTSYRIVCRFQEDLSLEDLYQYSRHRFSHDVV